MSADLVLAAGLVLLVGATVLLALARRLGREVRRVDWLLTRTEAAIGEAERAGRVRADLRTEDPE
ncbi:MAG TPA: hypothetical protein VFV67_16165 [Actinophytocola sp.]|uniref:hypothetical protein n=1 Tax=Actinophytocola sp. TaxID=1872138 RepID=UPI002DB75BB2|nr:hypothetical protein [Actinophytocola sp.]HEU5472189.1 hypothetical protein [Actinophytocola sp.]